MTIVQLRRLVAQKTKAFKMLELLADQKERELIDLELELEKAEGATRRRTHLRTSKKPTAR